MCVGVGGLVRQRKVFSSAAAPPYGTEKQRSKRKRGGDLEKGDEKKKHGLKKKFKCPSWKIGKPATTGPHDISEEKIQYVWSMNRPRESQSLSDVYLNKELLIHTFNVYESVIMVSETK